MKSIKHTLILFFLFTSLVANGQKAYFDLEFGKERTTTFEGIDIFSIEIDNNENIFAAGYLQKNTTDDYSYGMESVLLKMDSEGNLDKKFGEEGIAVTEVSQLLLKTCVLTIQSDGKIIVGSWCKGKDYYDIALIRYNTNGTLDKTFGNEGVSIIPLSTHSLSGDISILSFYDNSIWIGLYVSNEQYNVTSSVIIKITEDGFIDDDFQSNGVLYIPESMEAGLMGNSPKLLSLSDGSIFGIAISNTEKANQVKYCCFKIDENGEFDISFGENGVWVETIDSASTSDLSALEQQDGKIIIGSPSVGYKRLHSDGTLDEDFIDGGIKNGRDIFSQKDGKLLFVGPNSEATFQIIRVNNNGSIDFDISTPKIVGDYSVYKFINDRTFIACGLNSNNLVFTKVIIDPDATPIPNITNQESISVTQESENISVQSESPIQMIQLVN
ncbi:hypothetical protein LJB98_05590, partial [Bacteroidales bacterium OttesenSCG-928-M11]|nr:hypothetical protein [Bacteroidales bacterium OttesenSCG-928-M11]